MGDLRSKILRNRLSKILDKYNKLKNTEVKCYSKLESYIKLHPYNYEDSFNTQYLGAWVADAEDIKFDIKHSITTLNDS